MEERLAEMRKVIGASRESMEDHRRAITRKQFAEAAVVMEKMVAEGKAKPEDVKKRLAEMRRMMADVRNDQLKRSIDASDKENKAKFRAIEDKIRAAVEGGELTPADARKKLEAVKAKMSKDGKAENRKSAGKKPEDVDVLRDRMKVAVESGESNAGQAESRIRESRPKAKDRESREHIENPQSDPESKKLMHLNEMDRKIRQAVADGIITKEEAAAKMKAVKEKADQKDKGQSSQKDKGQ
jgi:hypothetical protein